MGEKKDRLRQFRSLINAEDNTRDQLVPFRLHNIKSSSQTWLIYEVQNVKIQSF